MRRATRCTEDDLSRGEAVREEHGNAEEGPAESTARRISKQARAISSLISLQMPVWHSASVVMIVCSTPLEEPSEERELRETSQAELLKSHTVCVWVDATQTSQWSSSSYIWNIAISFSASKSRTTPRGGGSRDKIGNRGGGVAHFEDVDVEPGHAESGEAVAHCEDVEVEVGEDAIDIEVLARRSISKWISLSKNAKGSRKTL